MTPLSLLLPFLVGVSLSACAAGPDQLAHDLQKAFQAGDIDAALKLGKFDSAPAPMQFGFLRAVDSCASADIVCTVSIQPLDDEYKSRQAAQAKAGMEISIEPLGLVQIETKAKDGSSHGTMRMPYAEVGGRTVLVTQRFSAAQLTIERNTSNDALLKNAVENNMLGAEMKSSANWQAAATPLPAGGGEPGKAFMLETSQLVAAAKAADPDAAMRASGPRSILFVDKNPFDGKPIDLAKRKRGLRAQSVRFLDKVEVTGGWQVEDHAVLIFTAVDGVGWIERGVAGLEKHDGRWDYGGSRLTVSYPPK